MIKLDLITGFLGAGKTTFIKNYARYLMSAGEKISIIENDFGAINVDMVLLGELAGENCNLEMIVGGDGTEAHKRRLKTKLISQGMMGYDRVIIEPSGLFDIDEFFDLIYEEPLDRWYSIGNVIGILDPGVVNGLSEQSEYLLMSELSQAGVVLFSRSDSYDNERKAEAIERINCIMSKYGSKRHISSEMIIDKEWKKLDIRDYEKIIKCGYNHNSYVKMPYLQDDRYKTLFYFDFEMEQEQLEKTLTELLNDEKCKGVFRIKGILKGSNNKAYEINITRYEKMTNPVHVFADDFRSVLIVIGEEFDEKALEKYLGRSTL